MATPSVWCRHCGTESSQGAKFCWSCGSALTTDAPEGTEGASSVTKKFSARFMGETYEHPAAFLRAYQEAPEGEENEQRVWPALSLFSRFLLENEGVDEELSEAVGPNQKGMLRLGLEDVEFCRSMAGSGSVDAYALATAYLLYSKEVSAFKQAVNRKEEAARLASRPLAVGEFESCRALMEELGKDGWRQRIADLRPGPGDSVHFLPTVFALFLAAEPGPGMDPEEWNERAKSSGELLSDNAWHYARQAISERQSNPNTREAVLSCMIFVFYWHVLHDPPAIWESFTEVAEGLTAGTVARCGKRAEDWIFSMQEEIVSYYEASSRNVRELQTRLILAGQTPDDRTGASHEFDIGDPVDKLDWTLLSLLACICHEFVAHDGGVVLAEEPHEPVEYCHVHAMAVSRHMVARHSGGWPDEVIEGAWRIIGERFEATSEAVIAFLLFNAQICRNDNDRDLWGRIMWNVEVLASNSGLGEERIEVARAAAERLFIHAHTAGVGGCGYEVGDPETPDFGKVTLGPWGPDA